MMDLEDDGFDPEALLASVPIADDFFDGFQEARLTVPGSEVFYRIGGKGPPLLLLHGYPQTSAMWHKIAPRLAQDYTVICPDLRGYGRSGKPASTPDHAPYSKRSMVGDLMALMDHLGYRRFLLGSHDRGARVAHRMAYDHPDRVAAFATLDIAPTREMYRDGGATLAKRYWHWFWLIQDAPFPERMIAANPRWFYARKLCVWGAGALPYVRQSLGEYLDAVTPEMIHASCEDYRAAWGIDRAHDDAETGKCRVPLLALWGKAGAIEAEFDALALWRERVETVEGRALPGGHFMAEEYPDEVLAEWLPWFERFQGEV